MLKKMVQLFFLIAGGTLGFLFIPDLIHILNVGEMPSWLLNPYSGAVIGAVLFFLLTFWIADYIVDFMKLMEESIVKAPVTDVLFGSMGLIIGLIVAYLITIPLNSMNFTFVSTVLPIFATIFLGYFGFQIGFKNETNLLIYLHLQEI